eukprot:353756-Chlamydomonas_euryale.AAC.3
MRRRWMCDECGAFGLGSVEGDKVAAFRQKLSEAEEECGSGGTLKDRLHVAEVYACMHPPVCRGEDV